MRHAEEELIAMGYDVLFVSMDRPEILVSNLTLDDVQYTLLSDADASLTKAFGLAYRVSDETVARYLNSGIDLEGDSGHDHHLQQRILRWRTRAYLCILTIGTKQENP